MNGAEVMADFYRLERVVAENQGGAFVSPSASPWGPKWKIDP